MAMKDFNGAAKSEAGINSKVSAPAGKTGKGLGMDPKYEGDGTNNMPAHNAKAAIKGFSGGVINPLVSGSMPSKK